LCFVLVPVGSIDPRNRSCVVRAVSSVMSVSAPAQWEPGGSEDLQQSFEEILKHISDTRKAPATPQPLAARAVPAATSDGIRRKPEWKRITTIGRELDPSVCLLGSRCVQPAPKERLKAWSPVTWAHTDSSFGFTGYLPQKDFNAWDKERVSNPERSWPADGAVSELYDTRRKGKPSWNPTNWAHKGRCFPLEAPDLPGRGLKIRRKRTPSFGSVPAELVSPSQGSLRASVGSFSPRESQSQSWESWERWDRESQSSVAASVGRSSGKAAVVTTRSSASAPALALGKEELRPRDRRKSELGLARLGPGPDGDGSDGNRVWSTFGEVLEGPR